MLKMPVRTSPMRHYEPNIAHNPRTWFGIWTPEGWRVHQKRWGRATRVTRYLSGDGKTTVFPGVLLDPETGQIEWQDDLHLKQDLFTDGGIYPADPRAEYPVGTPRWAVSHSLLCYPVADHNLHTHEYTWDLNTGELRTHFRRHIAIEDATTDSADGMTVTVKCRPISQTIEGNKHYAMPNSAVRGVWDNPEKRGENLYTARVVQLIEMHNAVYGVTPHAPVIQCNGIWPVLPTDRVGEVFDESGQCRDYQRLIEQFKISHDHPKLGMLSVEHKPTMSRIYEGDVPVIAEFFGMVNAEHLHELRSRRGSKVELGRVGYAAAGEAHTAAASYRGYDARYDLNGDGIIDERDEAMFAQNLGRTVRYNLYRSAYFGGNWISTGTLLAPEHAPGIPVVADYEYGGGYDAADGEVRLLRTPGPDRRVWVEYYHDAPAESGENNIRVHLYRES